MLLNQLILFGSISVFFCISVLFWIKWQKIGSILLFLIISILFIFSLGVVKSSILGSMRLDSFPLEINLETNSVFVSRGEAVLNTLRGWGKILRGKKPIYTTSGGSQISVNPVGDEKSIKIFKRF